MSASEDAVHRKEHVKNKKCFTCGAPCYGYQCRKHKKKGRFGSPVRREVNRRHTYRRYHENPVAIENVDAISLDEKTQSLEIIES